MIRFRVRLNGTWVEVDQGIILHKDRLAWWRGEQSGTASLGQWSLADSTINDSIFKIALWNGLTPEEQVEALSRMNAKNLVAA